MKYYDLFYTHRQAQMFREHTINLLDRVDIADIQIWKHSHGILSFVGVPDAADPRRLSPRCWFRDYRRNYLDLDISFVAAVGVKVDSIHRCVAQAVKSIEGCTPTSIK